MNTVQLKRKVFNGTAMRVCFRPLSNLRWAHKPVLIITEPKDGEHIETPCVVPLMPFMTICAHCAREITSEIKDVIHGAN